MSIDTRIGVQAKRQGLPVVDNRARGPRYRELVLHAPDLAARLRPGQFVNVACGDACDPFLRRPFSVYRMDRGAGQISLLYEVVGRGTAMMARWEPGDVADVLGPLGNWFTDPPGAGPVALVAGGVGVAPLVAFAEADAGAGRPMHAVLGARAAEMLLCEEDFRALGVPVDVATDDGSRGYPGFVSGLLQSLLRDDDPAHRFGAVLACGPRPMMAAVSRVAHDAGVPCIVSMEVNMACGFGVCMGCAWRVQPRTAAAGESPTPEVRYRLVCTDGPVFDAAEIVWDR